MVRDSKTDDVLLVYDEIPDLPNILKHARCRVRYVSGWQKSIAERSGVWYCTEKMTVPISSADDLEKIARMKI